MINFEDGVLVTPAKVNEDGTITPAQYSGKTPLSAYNLNRMQKLTECITGKSISASTIEGACKIKKVYGELEQESEPAPEIPVEIKVIGDNINLFDKNNISAGLGISYNTGSEYSNNTIFSTDYISINGIENLVWNGDSNSTNTWGAFYDENKTYLQGINVTNKKLTITNASAKYIKLTFLNEYLDTLKIEKGTVATGYTSYGNGGIDYKTVNKNMLGLIDGTYTQNGITVVVKDGKLTINGTATDVSLVNIPLKNEITIPFKTTYLLQAFNSSVPDGDNRLRLVTTSGTNPYSNCFLTKENSTVLIGNSTTEYTISHLVYRSSSGAVYNNFVVTPQLVLGETAQDYEFHKSQSTTIELPNGEFMAKIGDVEDYVDNKGILHKYIRKVVLTGTEEWNLSSNRFYTNVSDVSDGISLAKCTHYNEVPSWEEHVSKDMNFIIYKDTSWEFGRISIKNSNFTAVSDFQSWLAEQYANGTPVIIYYVLATPYEIDLDYNNILPQYKELTNIICSANFEIEFANSPAISSVNETFDKIQNENDTGWVDLSEYLHSEYITARFTPRARKINNVVYFDGEVYCIKDVGNNKINVLLNLPKWLLPNVAQISKSGFRWAVWKGYNMYIDQYGNLIVGEADNITVQEEWEGYQLSNISGYIVD